MRRLLYFSAFFLFWSYSFAALPEPKRIGYFSFWSFKRGYKIQEIPGQLLSHAIYSGLTITPNGECALFSKNPEDQNYTILLLKGFNELKAKFPHLKTMVSIGSLRDAGRFSDASSTAQSREKLADSCIKAALFYGFDGVDIDWEYPVHAINPKHGRPVDRGNFVLLIEEFRKKLGKDRILSIATTAYQSHLADLDVAGLSKSVDWFGIMAYDFCMGDSKRTCHHSILERTKGRSSDGKSAIDWYLNNGASKHQIVLGVPFYGYRWKVDSLARQGIDQKVLKEVNNDDYTGFMWFSEIETIRPKFKYFWDDEAKAPWLFNTKTKQAISFDDERSLKLKVNFVRKNAFGGMMIWEVPYDAPENLLLNVLQPINP